MVRIDMGAASEVCHVTQREVELFGLPDDVDDLVPDRRRRVQYEHLGGVQGPVGLDAGLPGKLLSHLYVHIRRRPGLAALGKFDLVSVHIIVLARLRAAPDGRVMLGLVIKIEVQLMGLDTRGSAQGLEHKVILWKYLWAIFYRVRPGC